MACSQYLDLPHYSALILRRNSVDLENSDAILERARRWWEHTGVANYNAKTRIFHFRNPYTNNFDGATVQFGHMNNERDKYKYQGAAWNFIGFDELTQFIPSQYTYMFSRLRRNFSENEAPIPSRIRCTSNPGGEGHYFVRDRFMSLEYAQSFQQGVNEIAYRQEKTTYIDKVPVGITERVFVPSKIKDNPSLDYNDYVLNLSELADVEKGQLLDGDWLITATGRFKPEWIKYYQHPDTHVSDNYQLMDRLGGNVVRQVHPNLDCTRLIVIDPAGTAAEAEAEDKGRAPSWSVISTFDITNTDKIMLWRDVVRIQEEFPEVVDAVCEEYYKQMKGVGHVRIVTEYDGIGKQMYQALVRRGIPIEHIGTEGKDKLARSTPAQIEAKEGRLYLPESASWLEDLKAELFVWTGLKGQVADQIDTLSYAAILKVQNSGTVVLDSFR